MDLSSEADGGASRLATYLQALSAAPGHADRVAPFRSYCTGLLLPGERKSVEPIAARVASATLRPCDTSTSTCRSLATISGSSPSLVDPAA